MENMSHAPGFLAHEEPPAIRPRRRLWFVVGAIAGSLFALWLIFVAVAAAQTAAAASDGGARLAAAQASAQRLDFAAAEQDAALADASFAQAETHLAWVKPLSFFPWIGTQIDAVDAGLRAGRDVLSGVQRLTSIGADLVRLSGLSSQDLASLAQGVSGRTTFNDLSPDTKRALLARVAAAAPDLERMADDISIARSDLASVPSDQLSGPVASALRPLDAKLSKLGDDVRVAASAARLLPAFAGLDGVRTTLVLFLNNAELRPGGGFVGSFGRLSMQDGSIASLGVYDAYALDQPAAPAISTPPPAPLARYLGDAKYLFRDANWSPDFAVSARTLLERRRAEIAAVAPAQRTGPLEDVPVQNVAGLTPTFFSALLRIVGPVSVGGQTFTADNIYDAIQYQVDVGYARQGVPPAQRKELLGALLAEGQKRLYALPFDRWGDVLAAVEDALQTKQMAVYSEDQSVEDAITASGWGGRVLPPPDGQDALMAVDANLASLKSDPVVDRSVAYQLRLNNSRQLVATATIRYAHHGVFDWKTTRYRSYVRLYVPLGSTLVKTTGSLADDKTRNPTMAPGTTDIGTDLGFTTFGTFVAVEPGETRDLTFEYVLPERVSQAEEAGSYRLTVFKQMGAAPRALTLDLAFDKNVATATPPEAPENWGDASYTLNTILDQDRMFAVGF